LDSKGAGGWPGPNGRTGSRDPERARSSTSTPAASFGTPLSSRCSPRSTSFPDCDETYHGSYAWVRAGGMLLFVDGGLRTVDPMIRHRCFGSVGGKSSNTASLGEASVSPEVKTSSTEATTSSIKGDTLMMMEGSAAERGRCGVDGRGPRGNTGDHGTDRGVCRVRHGGDHERRGIGRAPGR
jgi:hypothetical protein